MDHVISKFEWGRLGLGQGVHHDDNLQSAHRVCNEWKGIRIMGRIHVAFDHAQRVLREQVA